MSIKRKYVDSHWLIFALEGAIALLFGWFALFTNLSDTNALVSIVGSMLLGLGIIELTTPRTLKRNLGLHSSFRTIRGWYCIHVIVYFRT